MHPNPARTQLRDTEQMQSCKSPKTRTMDTNGATHIKSPPPPLSCLLDGPFTAHCLTRLPCRLAKARQISCSWCDSCQVLGLHKAPCLFGSGTLRQGSADFADTSRAGKPRQLSWWRHGCRLCRSEEEQHRSLLTGQVVYPCNANLCGKLLISTECQSSVLTLSSNLQHISNFTPYFN